MDTKDLENRFNYHAPDDDKIYRHGVVRKQCLQLAMTLSQMAPESDELKIAIARLEEVMFWSNAAIARHG